MRMYGAPRFPEKVQATIHWVPPLIAIPIATAVGIYGLSLGRDWRLTASTLPLDAGPERGMLLVAAAAVVTMVGGLGLMVTLRGAIGVWLFAIGVALVCGVMVGFVTGPTV